MLYRYEEGKEDGERVFYLDKMESFSTDEGGLPYHIRENTLENIFAEIFALNGVYMPIFQERPFQPEPDLVALDEHGNLILFELKRGYIDKKSALDDRLFRYHSVWKNFSYDDLNKNYRKYKKDNSADLLDDHKKFFGFNRAQKLIAVANVVSDDLIDYIESLNKRGDYTVDFIPYRFYKVGGEVFVEFSSKPFDDDFVARRRHNLICKIANSINGKMNDSFCSSHKFSRKSYFDGSNLDLRKWNGHERFILSFSRELLFSGATDLHVQGFSLGVGGKNFYISFRVRNNQDSVVSCSEAAKNISALNDVKFKRMSDSKGEEYFRYDLPISSKYPTVDFVEMDDAARSLFDKKNFDAAIVYMMTELEQCINLLSSSASTLPTKIITPPDFKAVEELGEKQLPLKTNGSCGTNLIWRLDDAGILTISGTGAMYNYSFDNKTPWYDKRDSIKSVIIEDGIKVIGERAFQDCKSLISVQLPCSLNKIGADAFSGCARLEEITIPNGVTFIGNNAFNSCGSLKTISIPTSVETIEYFAFAFCYKLESVEILGSLDEIAGGTFQSCYRLREVKIHGTVTTISDGDGGHGAFQMCKKLANVNQILKDSIKKIGKYSFRWCENLQSVTIPSSVTDIGIQIFNGCTNLKEIRYKCGLRSADKLNDGNSARLVPY